MDSEVFLLLMLVGVFAGFVDSAVGGGGLLRLPAMLSAGLPPHVALGTNKFASAAAAAIASVKYLQSGIVPRKAAFIGCSLMVLFSIIGASVVLSISAALYPNAFRVYHPLPPLSTHPHREYLPDHI